MSVTSVEEHKSIVLRGLGAVATGENLALAAESMVLDMKRHSLGALFPGAETIAGIQGFMRSMRAALADLRMDVHDVIAEGDRVVVRYTMSGVHIGDLFGYRATGRSIAVPGISIYRLAEGKIAETWQLVSELVLLEQIGAYAPPAAPAVE